jgi:hypothetical protein
MDDMRIRNYVGSAAVLLTIAILAACRPGPERRETAASPPAAAQSANGQPGSTPATTRVDPPVTSEAPISRAVPFTGVDLTACLRTVSTATPSEALCPAFISEGLAEMTATCSGVGGRLAAGERPSLWSLDVNGDGRDEFLYDATDNFSCEGAASVFSCGSLGCPVSLFEQRGTAWFAIGAMRASDVPAAEVLPPAPGEPRGTLRSGCVGDRPCDERVYYRWNGRAYEDAWIDVRGRWVDIANDGLWTMVGDAAILAAPSPDAAVLARYPQGTEVVVLGQARDSQYKYVSPCNACQNGFIDPAALRKTF